MRKGFLEQRDKISVFSTFLNGLKSKKQDKLTRYETGSREENSNRNDLITITDPLQNSLVKCLFWNHYFFMAFNIFAIILPRNIISQKKWAVSTLTRHKNTCNLTKRKWTKSSPVPLDTCWLAGLQLRKLHILKNKSNNYL